MANTRYQAKRTSVSGRTPNTTNSGNSQYIDSGEFAINLADQKVYTSNGTVAFEVGSNLTSIQITGPITANGGVGSAGQVLKSGGAGANIYWDTASGGSVGGSNTQVQFNDSGAANGASTFTFDKTTSTVTTANLVITNTATINTNSITVGNSTVNSFVSNTFIRVSNSTTYANLTTISLNIGANLVANTTEVTAGNTTTHSSMTHTYIHVINSTATANLTPASISIGANAYMNTTALFVGNSTVNTFITQNLLDIGGQINANGSVGTAGHVLTSGGAANAYWAAAAGGGTPAGSNTYVQFNDSGAFGGSAGFVYNKSTNTVSTANLTVNGTATINADSISIGNTVANMFANSVYLRVANSTANSIVIPGEISVGGITVGYRDIPQNIQNATYGFVLGDAGKLVGKDNATAYTYTIPANGTTAFPIGTAITIFNGNATSNITVAITTDTLRLAGTTTTGSRTLAPWGIATAVKIASTVWLISGSGLT